MSRPGRRCKQEEKEQIRNKKNKKGIKLENKTRNKKKRKVRGVKIAREEEIR